MSDVTLQSPIKRGAGNEPIKSLSVRKPLAGELRGLKLTDVLQMDVGAMLILLPRITSPAILPDEAASLDLADLMALSGKVVGFFMSSQDRAAAGIQ